MTSDKPGVVGRTYNNWTVEALDDNDVVFRYDHPNGSCAIVALQDDGQVRFYMDGTEASE